MAEAVWTAIGLTRDIEPGAATGVVIDGREWALWRGVSGRLHLWEDRCPHRGMRLSLGFVGGDRFGCLYHGWKYDETGQCAEIPAQPELKPPSAIRVRGVPVAECGGVIWACFADEPPALPSFANAEPVRSLYLDAPLSEALAALDRATPAAGAADAYRVEVEGDDLLVAGQRIDESHSALHIAAFGGTSSARRAANWAVRLRRERELELA